MRYIASIAPLKRLPRVLIPRKGRPLPPLVEYAWLLTDEVRRSLMAEANKRQLNFYFEKSILQNDPEHPGLLSVLYEKVLDERTTLERAGCAIIAEMQLEEISICQFITGVLTRGQLYASAFTVYNNRDLDRDRKTSKPVSDDAVRALGERLGFVGMPAWFPSGVRFQWVEEEP